MIDKVLPGNETILLIPATEVNGVPYAYGATSKVIYSAITAAVLNRWIPIVTNGTANSGAGGNISCAVRDDSTLGLKDSSTDSDRTICSTGDAEDLTFYNFDAELTTFRDASLTSTSSVFNLARDLMRAPDVPYIIAHRIGLASTAAAVIGQRWDFYYAWTDNPIPNHDDQKNQTIDQKFVQKSIVNIGYNLAA